MLRQAHYNRRGVTMIELVIVVAVTAILAAAFSSVLVPTMNTLFYFPQGTRVNAAAASLVDIIIEGDNLAKGLRYAGPACVIGGGGGGGSTITAASTTSLTYNYVDADYCGFTAARTSHTVVLALDTVNDVVTRTIDGGAAANIPDYATTAADIDFNAPSGTTFFTYYDAAGTDLGGTPVVASIYRVDVNVIATSGSGEVKHTAGQIRLESGVNIQRYTT